MESILAARLGRPPAPLLGGLARRLQLAPRRAALVALAAALLGGGYLLLRDSPLVAVEQVQIAGVAGPESAAVSRALESAAKRMSTLDYSASVLQAAVARYPVVRSLSVTTSFPHRLRILVREQPPVAQVSAAGVHTAVAADGVVLGQALVSRSLPDIPVGVAPSVGRRVRDARVRAYLRVLGAAPYPLLRLVARVYTSDRGITAQMRGGLLIYFGDAGRPDAKWDALVTVLSDPGSQGASYVDVRVPERAASGGSERATGGEASGVSASDPTSAALAESLAHAVNGEPTTPLSSTAATTAEPSTATPAAPTATAEPSSGAEASEPAAGASAPPAEASSSEPSTTGAPPGG